MRGDFLVQVPDQRLVRYFGMDEDAVVPKEIAILGRCCFSACRNLTSISFAERSELKEIEQGAMRFLDLLGFHIPRTVERIPGTAFSGCGSPVITIDPGNRHFRLDGQFLVDFQGRTLIRSFGASSRARISRTVEILAAGCFEGDQLLLRCDFEQESQLREVREQAFSGCLLWDIRLPPSVRYIGRNAFMCTCRISIPELSPENQARLAKWQAERQDDQSAVLDLRPS
jgi:hypothetical protein